MPDLNFSVADVVAAQHAATPTLNFHLTIGQALAPGAQPERIQSVALQCQIRIDAKKRIYKAEEQERLTDLFGAPERWGQTLHSMLWTHAHVVIPAFDQASTTVVMPVPCSFDFNLAATKYFHGLEFGKVPLLLLFSGSVFYRDAEGALAMQLISWEQEAKFRLPVTVWQEMMDRYYPNHAWLCLDRRIFDALHEYKRAHGYTGFDEALAGLLPDADDASNRQAS